MAEKRKRGLLDIERFLMMKADTIERVQGSWCEAEGKPNKPGNWSSYAREEHALLCAAARTINLTRRFEKDFRAILERKLGSRGQKNGAKDYQAEALQDSADADGSPVDDVSAD